MSEIRFTGVSHHFGDRPVLSEVDLTLTERRIGLVGANGSGKSTLARMINGLIVPASGTVTVDGLNTAREGGRVRKLVGFVFTDPDSQIVMPTVAEDVAFSLRRQGLPAGEVTARVRDTLQRFDLARHADHPTHQLSGGQKQLLALAAVLVTAPAVLVADEPTTLLDARNNRRVADLMAALPQQIVLVTHHLELLAGFDRVLVVEDGRIAADGPPTQALDSYQRLLAR